MTIRAPVIVIVAHVDHGKTTLLDKIRGTNIVAGEAGKITQHVGASFIPIETIKERTGELLQKYGFNLTIPGLLFIDTPGHEAFTNLRKRGGSIADLAVLVIDVTQGIQPQTKESIEILKVNKVPFIVAANKIDLIQGWQSEENAGSLKAIKNQREHIQEQLDTKIYNIVGELARDGFNSERFDRVTDLTQEVLIIPISAKTGEGIQELLLFLAGLSQKFISEKLDIDTEAPAKGTILEVKEVQGLGTTIDAIIYDGKISQGDVIALAGNNGVFTTKIRALLEPQPLEEIRDPKKKFKSVKEVYAAAGVKIAAPGLEEAIAGSPILVAKDEQAAKEEIERELQAIKIDTEAAGVIVKADALGSLEAIVNLFKVAGIPIKKADVGKITTRDLLAAETVKKENRYLGCIFAFNIAVEEDVKTEAKARNIALFNSDIIYKLEEDYSDWKKIEEKKAKEEALTKYIYPAKMHILKDHTFRISKPAVVGVEILGGMIKQGYPLMNDEGETIGRIQSIQTESQKKDKAEKGEKVALSIEGATVGRNIHEGQILFTAVPKSQIYELEEKFEDKELIKEIKRLRK